MDTFEALYTTRAMRRVKPDPIPEEVVQRMLDAGIRAPSPGNTQQWRFVTVTDRELVAQLGALYERSWAQLEATVYAGKREQAEARGDLVTKRVLTSSSWLAANFSQVPLVILPFVRNDPDGSGIYPAVWNLMLAARAGCGDHPHDRPPPFRSRRGRRAPRGSGREGLAECGRHHLWLPPRHVGCGRPPPGRTSRLRRSLGPGAAVVGPRTVVELLAS